MKFRPLGNRIVLRGQGFYNDEGKIIPITNIKVGDLILLPEHSGIDIKDEQTQETIRVVSATEVIGILQK